MSHFTVFLPYRRTLVIIKICAILSELRSNRELNYRASIIMKFCDHRFTCRYPSSITQRWHPFSCTRIFDNETEKRLNLHKRLSPKRSERRLTTDTLRFRRQSQEGVSDRRSSQTLCLVTRSPERFEAIFEMRNSVS